SSSTEPEPPAQDASRISRSRMPSRADVAINLISSQRKMPKVACKNGCARVPAGPKPVSAALWQALAGTSIDYPARLVFHLYLIEFHSAIDTSSSFAGYQLEFTG